MFQVERGLTLSVKKMCLMNRSKGIPEPIFMFEK